MVGDGEDGDLVLVRVLVLGGGRVVQVVLQGGGGVELFAEHHLLQKDNGAHGMIQRQLVLVQLGQNCANV